MKKYQVALTNKERLALQTIIAKRNTKNQAVKRAYILLAADENQSNWLKITYLAYLSQWHENPTAKLAAASQRECL